MKRAASGRGRRFVANLGLALITCAVALIVAELSIRRFVTLRSVGAPVTTWDPVYRTRLKANFSGVQITPEFRQVLTTNSLGFRGPEPTGSLTGGLLYLGDSFTVGYGVNDGREFPALVAERLRARGITLPWINAGRGNTGQSQWIKFLRREGRKYDPAFVVVQINETDFDDNLIDGLLHVDSAGNITELPVRRPSLGRLVQPVLDAFPFVPNSHLYGLVRQAYFALTARPPEGPPDPAVIERQHWLLARLIEEVDRLCEEGGWPIVALRVGLNSERDAFIDSLLTARGIPSRRIPTRDDKPELYYAVDGHWTMAGHEYAAKVTVELLEQTDSARLYGRKETR